jgi:hypothetical protein
MKLLRYLPRFRQAERSLIESASRESWLAHQIADWQLACINRVWEQAVRTVPHYSDVRRTLALPGEFQSIEEFTSLVPRLDKTLVRQQPERFLSGRAAAGSWRWDRGIRW